MEGLLFILSLFVILVLIRVAEMVYYSSLEREKESVMADYLKAEDARFHYQHLATIDAAVQVTGEEMARIAAEARGDVIEGTAVEERRS